MAGKLLKEDSEAMHWVKAVATAALVMALTAKLIVFPSGTLQTSPLWLRLGAAAIGFAAFLLSGNRVIVGVVVSLALLVAGLAVLVV